MTDINITINDSETDQKQVQENLTEKGQELLRLREKINEQEEEIQRLDKSIRNLSTAITEMADKYQETIEDTNHEREQLTQALKSLAGKVEQLEHEEERNQEEETLEKQSPEASLELPIEYEKSTKSEREQAIIQAVLEADKALTYYEIASRAFGIEVGSDDKEYKMISATVNKFDRLNKDASGKKNLVSDEEINLEEPRYEADTAECRYCGRECDKRGLHVHEESCPEKDSEKEHQETELSELQERLLNKMNQRNYKSSQMLAAGIENMERSKLKHPLSNLSQKGFVEGKRGYGYRLTDKGKKVQEDGETSEAERIDPDALTTEERVEKAKEIWDEVNQPLTRNELAKKVYELPEDFEVSTNSDYYMRADSVIKKLRKQNKIEKVEDSQSQTSYILNHSEDEEAQDRMDWERVKREAGVSDKDVAIVTLAFEKMVNRKGMEEIDYYDFEKHYTGQEQELRMFQKLFENTEFLNGIRKEVTPDKRWKWEKSKYSGEGVKEWVLKIQD